MNILLANMPIEFNRRESLEPPLGICYIAAINYARKLKPNIVRFFAVSSLPDTEF